MKIVERDGNGEKKSFAIDLNSRIYAEEIKAETLTIEEVPEAFKEETQLLLSEI